MNTRIAALISAVAVALLAGCQTARPLYFWGNYEGDLYKAYSKPGAIPPQEAIARLEEDIAKAAAAGLPPNPGLHAQLGYYHLESGDVDAARAAFEAEKRLFPESAVLMDRMIGKLQPTPAP